MNTATLYSPIIIQSSVHPNTAVRDLNYRTEKGGNKGVLVNTNWLTGLKTVNMVHTAATSGARQ